MLVMEKGQVKGEEAWKLGAKVTFSCELLQRGLVIDTKGKFAKKKNMTAKMDGAYGVVHDANMTLTV